VPYAETGTVEEGQGNHTPVRWDEKTGVVQVRLYRLPMNKPPHWVWGECRHSELYRNSDYDRPKLGTRLIQFVHKLTLREIPVR